MASKHYLSAPEIKAVEAIHHNNTI